VKILLTGFDRFGDLPFNPSELTVRAMPARADLVCEILPTEYERAGTLIRERIAALRPDIVLGTGVAAARPSLCLERVALNIDDAEIADNAGALRSGAAIAPSGPLALEAIAVLPPILARLRERGIEAAISTHAGTFVCNHVFYSALVELKRVGSEARCVFVHLPMREKVEEFVSAIELVLAELARQRTPSS
jgi:pyroglutamyl-peptidase